LESMKTEKALNLWLEDMNRKRVPINGTMLQEKALSIYAMFKPPAKEGQPSDKKEFKASQGWLNSFRNRFNLRNVQTTGEVASANEEAAKAYPEQLKQIIEERGYLPEQVSLAVSRPRTRGLHSHGSLPLWMLIPMLT
uniref:HTH CENPB-type domain-containing protein n=1 Tax=Chelydra serpentina TaxID=8475 RepID=A0A8C3S184_CHESE